METQDRRKRSEQQRLSRAAVANVRADDRVKGGSLEGLTKNRKTVVFEQLRHAVGNSGQTNLTPLG